MADVGKLFKVSVAFLVRDGLEQIFRLTFPDVEVDHFPGLGKKWNECGVIGLGSVQMDIYALVRIWNDLILSQPTDVWVGDAREAAEDEYGTDGSNLGISNFLYS